jgi:alpha-beta hydrolase superfamily lysophospholipase
MNDIMYIGIWTGVTFVSLYITVCAVLYFVQERFIFLPNKLAKDHKFKFKHNFEEINIRTSDNINLHGVLFKSEESKGLIFYLHGNTGAIDFWGKVSKTYIDIGYDVFFLDYRGYGKSEGKIESELQFFNDVQKAYDLMKSKYVEKNIIILGNSVGTASAAWLASRNKPKHLILHAPYYTLTSLIKQSYWFILDVVVKYKFETARYVKKTKVPITIFHGERDKKIKYVASIRLAKLFKTKDRLLILENGGHTGLAFHPAYQKELRRICD